MFGDNLPWLRDRNAFPDASVDLVYLDPPFNSDATYNVLFREESGEASRAQFHAFTDTWHWPDAEATYREFIQTCPMVDAVTMLEAFHSALKTSPMMAYLAMMAPRLVELHRLLKPTGSLYLHCDPTASHYLKLLLDAIFGPTTFRNEVIWKRTSAHSSAKRYGPVHDVILFYCRSESMKWIGGSQAYEEGYVQGRFRMDEKRPWKDADLTGTGVRHGETGLPWRGFNPTTMGRHWAYPPTELDKLDAQGMIYWPKKKGGWPRFKRYLDEARGIPLQDVWTDIFPINSQAQERLGYPTQKPEALLERIISASSNEGDAVLDPFCGCGTTIAVAQRLKRSWAGIDVTYLAINLIKRRLDSAFGRGAVSFLEKGQPVDLSSAQRLAELDRFQFQQWALNLVGAMPLRPGEGKGADRGADGLLYFHESKDERRRVLVQVKSGGVKRGDVATLLGDVANQKAIGGILITLDAPTAAMKKEAVEAGRYTSVLWKRKDYPKIQMLTIGGLLEGAERPDTPPLEDPFAKAPKADSAEQQDLALPTAAETPAAYRRRKPKPN